MGLTLVEVIVALAIIGILIALLVPAVQSARESSRRAACANNLHELVLAVKLHEQSHQIFPTGGWGPDWVGDPDSGFGTAQSGGWIYNVLPYIEEGQLRELGRGQSSPSKRAALRQVIGTAVPVFSCPTRRAAEAYPFHGPSPMRNVDPPDKVGKSDYVINREISYQKSEVLASNIQRKRGLSKTLLVGEKVVDQRHYQDGEAGGDMMCMYVGDCADIGRPVSGVPMLDAQGGDGIGSAHPTGCNVAMGDASVRFVSFNEQLQP